MGKPRRRLSDLYKTREVVEFDDGTDDPIKVVVVKLNRPEREAVIRRANAARGRVLASVADQDGERYQSVLASVHDIVDPERLIDIIVMPDMNEIVQSIEAELESESPWGDDDYLQGLRDAWLGDENEDGLQEVWLAGQAKGNDPDPEAERVYAELSKFNDELSKRVTEERDNRREVYESYLGDGEAGLDHLRREATKTFIKIEGEQAFSDEYIRQRTFYSVRRHDDPKSRYFSDLAELDDCADFVRSRLVETYDQMAAEGTEGKESPAAESSSPPSESPGEAEPSKDSGLAAATPSRTSPTSS